MSGTVHSLVSDEKNWKKRHCFQGHGHMVNVNQYFYAEEIL